MSSLVDDLRKTGRHLASIQVISKISDAPRLDRLEYLTVSGWKCLAPKGMYKEGDKVVFFEPDSLLPVNYGVLKDEDNSTGVTRYRVRATNIRGNHTAGFVVPLDTAGVSGEVGDDVTDKLGVVKYLSPADIASYGGNGIIGKFVSFWCPKSDATRIQNYAEHYEDIRALDWDVSVKCDGTSRTLVNDGGKIRYFTRNNEIEPTELLEKVSPVEQLLELGDGFAVQYELLGPKIQANPLKLPEQVGKVFAVWYKRESIDRKDWPDFPETVKSVDDWVFPETYDEALVKVDGISGAYSEGRLDEGLVFCLKNHQELPDWFTDQTRRFKILNQSYVDSLG